MKAEWPKRLEKILNKNLFIFRYFLLFTFSWGFLFITSHFTGKCRRNSFHFNISLIELL